MEKIKMTFEEFENAKAEMIRLADEMWKTYGYPYWIDYPVSLSDKKYEVFGRYWNFVCMTLYWDVVTKDAKPDTTYELLPAWYTIPNSPIASIGWRMGGGESYLHCLWAYQDALSKEELAAWEAKYPTPPHFDEGKMEEYFAAHPEIFEENGD